MSKQPPSPPSSIGANEAPPRGDAGWDTASADDAVEVLDALDAAVALYDRENRLLLCNREFRRLYAPLADELQPGLPFETLVRRAVGLGLVPDASADPEAFIAQRVQQQGRILVPVLRHMADGRWRRIAERRLADGKVLSFSIDVTELVEQGRALEAAQREAERARLQFEEALEALPAGVEVYDAEDRLVLANSVLRELYPSIGAAMGEGLRFEDLLRRNLAAGGLPGVAPDDEEWIAARLASRRSPGEPIEQCLESGRWIRTHERRMRDGGLVGVRVDITELREANERLMHLSETDALTGIANRRRFDRALHDEWQRGTRHGAPLALLLVDVDHFKRYNDSLGHRLGDDCLRAIAQLLHGCARRAGDLVARYGGEEFALLLPHTGADEAAAIAQACLDAVDGAELPHPDSPLAAHVTLSIGVAGLAADPARAAETLLEAADAAMYAAKRAGRHRVVAAG